MYCTATRPLETQELPSRGRSVCQCLVRPLYPMGGSNLLYNLEALKYYITSHHIVSIEPRSEALEVVEAKF